MCPWSRSSVHSVFSIGHREDVQDRLYAMDPPPREFDDLAQLFSDAAAGTLDDKKLAARVNHWLPSNLRPTPAPKGQ